MGKKNGGWGINKFSFYAIGVFCVLLLTIMVLNLVGVSTWILPALEAVVKALLLIVPAVCAWNYVANKQTVWKVLYFIFLLILLITIIIPALHTIGIF